MEGAGSWRYQWPSHNICWIIYVCNIYLKFLSLYSLMIMMFMKGKRKLGQRGGILILEWRLVGPTMPLGQLVVMHLCFNNTTIHLCIYIKFKQVSLLIWFRCTYMWKVLIGICDTVAQRKFEALDENFNLDSYFNGGPKTSIFFFYLT